MAETRWDPFGEMMNVRETMDRLLRDSFARAGSSRDSLTADVFPVDVGETGDAYVVRAYIPGVTPETAQLSVHGDTLTIGADIPEHDAPDVESWLMREQRPGPVERTIRLPSMVDPERAVAHCEHGVLWLELPKASAAMPRRVPVVGSASPAPKFDGSKPAAAARREGDVRRDDVVAEASDMSFPASDPPSWSPGRPGGGS